MTREQLHAIALSAPDAGDNRQWVHLVPAGTVMARDGRGPWTLRDPEAVIAATRERHGRTQMVVDYEHQTINSQKNGQPAPAAGWIVGLEARKDGIWGLVEWTAEAAKHIGSRSYRYLSPVMNVSKSGEIASIANAALTNSPALDELTAVARREDEMDELDALREALDLDGAADMAAIVAAVKALKIRPEAASTALPDPAKFVPIGDFERAVKEANGLRQGVTEQTARAHVAEHIRAGALAPFLKDWGIQLCTVNKEAFDSFVERTGRDFMGIASPQLGDRAVRRVAARVIDTTETEICSRLGISAEDFAKTRKAAAENED